jgi:hypothetical protein
MHLSLVLAMHAGSLRILTEFGILDVEPTEVRGMRLMEALLGLTDVNFTAPLPLSARPRAYNPTGKKPLITCAFIVDTVWQVGQCYMA